MKFDFMVIKRALRIKKGRYYGKQTAIIQTF